MTCSCANTLFGNSTGDDHHVGRQDPQPSKISANNIIRPSFDELSEDQRQAFEALKKRRQKEVEALLRKKEEEDMEAFLASFKKDHQGTITSTGEVKLPPLLSKPTEPSVSTSQFLTTRCLKLIVVSLMQVS